MRTVRGYLDRALDLLQRHSLESPNADWPVLRAEAHLAAAAARGPEDTYPAIRQVIDTLGNPHTHLIRSHRSRPAPERTVPTGRLVGSTAWLRLPQTDSRNGTAYATAGLDVLRDLITSGPSGWVVDLRGNQGGDMHPMLTVTARCSARAGGARSSSRTAPRATGASGAVTSTTASGSRSGG